MVTSVAFAGWKKWNTGILLGVTVKLDAMAYVYKNVMS